MKRILIVGTCLSLSLTTYGADSDPSPTPTPLPFFYSTPAALPKDTIDRVILQWAVDNHGKYKSLQDDKNLICMALENRACAAAQATILLTRLSANKQARRKLKEDMKVPRWVTDFNPKLSTASEWANRLSYNEKMRLSESFNIPKDRREQYPKPETPCSIM